MDREKVIGHLGILRTWCAVNPAYGRGLDVEECGRAVGWLDDAIGMMQAEGERETTSSVSAGGADTFPRGEGEGEAQGPRVMTLEEYKALAEKPKEERDPVWEEWPGLESSWAIPNQAYGGYNTSWRCWTSRPDQATREATPWINQ